MVGFFDCNFGGKRFTRPAIERPCIGFLFRKSYPLIRWYHAVNFVLLSGFLLGWHWIPQELNKSFIPFIFCLWVVSGLQFVVLKRRKNE